MLDNKLVVDKLNLQELLTMNLPNTMGLRQEEYDLLQTPDPNTLYLIVDAEDRRVYYGRSLITIEATDRIYLIGPGNSYGEYKLYLNEKIGYEDRLIEISVFNDPQKAIDAMNRYNRVGSHTNLSLWIYELLITFLLKETTLHEFLIGIIAAFGYRDDRRLQELIQVTMSLGAQDINRELPLLLKDELPQMKRSPNHLFRFYSNLYDQVVLHNFFKEAKYRKDPYEIDLSKEVDAIFKTLIRVD